jgi:hypothetical protein
MDIELVIDEIVLHGFDPRQRHAIADAVTAELTRLLHAQAGQLHAGRFTHVPQANGGTFEAPSPTPPTAAGAGIARCVWTAVRGSAP